VKVNYFKLKKRRLDITEDICYEMNWKKTATLIAARALELNLLLKMKTRLNMRKFGTHRYGFQNKDDLSDYSRKLLGKNHWIDIRVQK
jgi:geranylgeranyl pyrophosphate synthase